MNKMVLVVLFLFAINFDSKAQSNVSDSDAKSAATNIIGMDYPKFDAQLRAIFRVDARTAQKVQLDLKEVGDARTAVKSLCASAARDEKSGDIILKVVNASSQSLETQIDLNGAGIFTGSGKAIVLTSASPLDENTLENPTKVSPKDEELSISGDTITRSFSGNSLTIIRIPTVGRKK